MAFTALFGGTFNPFHTGHYEMLRALHNADFVEKVLIVPDRIPPHKTCDFLANDEDRIALCRLAAEDFPKAQVCLIEFEREGKSYSFDTVTLLKARFPQTEFAFVCGGDMLVTLDKWYRYQELIKLIPFIVFRRSDIDNTLFDKCVERFRGMGAEIRVMAEVIPAVSSSYIREHFEISKNMLPPKIYDYLADKGIYNAKNS